MATNTPAIAASKRQPTFQPQSVTTDFRTAPTFPVRRSLHGATTATPFVARSVCPTLSVYARFWPTSSLPARPTPTLRQRRRSNRHQSLTTLNASTAGEPLFDGERIGSLRPDASNVNLPTWRYWLPILNRLSNHSRIPDAAVPSPKPIGGTQVRPHFRYWTPRDETTRAIHRSHNMVFTLGLRHTFPVWRRGLALVQSSLAHTSLASFRAVS